MRRRTSATNPLVVRQRFVVAGYLTGARPYSWRLMKMPSWREPGAVFRGKANGSILIARFLVRTAARLHPTDLERMSQRRAQSIDGVGLAGLDLGKLVLARSLDLKVRFRHTNLLPDIRPLHAAIVGVRIFEDELIDLVANSDSDHLLVSVNLARRGLRDHQHGGNRQPHPGHLRSRSDGDRQDQNATHRAEG